MKKRLPLTISLLAPMLLVCIASGLVLRGYWREQAGRKLILAIKANDTARALDALRAHADPNVRDQSDAMPSLREYLTKLWLQMRGIKLTSPNASNTALGLAVINNNAVVAEALLTRGARASVERIPIQYANGITLEPLTVLMVAARNKNPLIVQSLLKHGCYVNETDQAQQTALFYADDAATVRMLVTGGANINARDSSECTALDEHLKAESDEAADTLLDLGAHDPQALTLAAGAHNPAPLKKMLDMGWKVNTRDDYGETPLTAAIGMGSRGELDKVLLLIQRGANVNARDQEWQTPLLLAAEGGSHSRMHGQSPDVITALLAHGARINDADREGLTPLMVAASNLRPILVRLLLKEGARVNMRTKKGETALSLARHKDYLNDEGQAEIVKILRKAGAKE